MEAPQARLRAAERAENFPVALRVLPARYRRNLVAVYDVVRVIDDLGDEDTGAADRDRTAQLRDFAADLATVWTGSPPRSPVLRRLVPTVRDCDLPQEHFDRLIAANLQDQRVGRYETWDELLGYCELSAVPIGRLVLAVFGVPAPAGSAIERESDAVCTALQLLEHWQDVGEDRGRGRVYLPAADLAAFGVPESALDAPAIDAPAIDAPASSPALRALMAHETGRAVAMLDDGAALVGRLRGWARLAVAGYVAGGYAAADGLRRAGYEVLGGSPGTRRSDVARHLLTRLVFPTRMRSTS
ncbi:squalene synthase HpnC [Pseudonocardia aurantiaca]|uniref:Squalene synthase HpnC n=1 Tax=Pseudonocardia aurantiaca TaxID=75290 RepID=A0ABW4FMQ3_9PSEU